MNIYFRIVLALMIPALFASCSKEDGFGADSNGETAQVDFRKMIISIDNSENLVRAGSDIDVSNFLVDLYQGENKVESYVYAEMPQVVTLPVGAYTVKVRSAELEAAAWSKPYYFGSRDFTVQSGIINEVDPVECKFSNIRVTVLYDAELKAHMAADAGVNVLVGDQYTLDFLRDETRSGYFAYTPESQTLVATFTGLVDDNTMENLRTYTDVAPGNHYKITYRYHDAELPGTNGAANVGIKVEATIEVENISMNVVPGDDLILKDDDRPTNGDKEPDTPVDPSDPDKGPVLVPSDGLVVNDGYIANKDNAAKGAVINQVYENSTVVLNITSETGLTEFRVIIDSPLLTAAELEEVGLSADLDFVNGDPELWAKLNGLGLDTDLGGRKEVNFNISGFMGLLNLLGEADHNFILIVSDAEGSITKTLVLHNNK